MTKMIEMDDKTKIRIEVLRAAAALAVFQNPAEAYSVLADAERALKRCVRRAEALPEEWERVEIAQSKGPTLEFTGRLIGSQSFATHGREPMQVEFEIWETRAGAMVAVRSTTPTDREGLELVRAAVIEPGEDQMPRRLAVMEHFDWSDRARTMAKKLGWSFRQEVE